MFGKEAVGTQKAEEGNGFLFEILLRNTVYLFRMLVYLEFYRILLSAVKEFLKYDFLSRSVMVQLINMWTETTFHLYLCQ